MKRSHSLQNCCRLLASVWRRPRVSIPAVPESASLIATVKAYALRHVASITNRVRHAGRRVPRLRDRHLDCWVFPQVLTAVAHQLVPEFTEVYVGGARHVHKPWQTRRSRAWLAGSLLKRD